MEKKWKQSRELEKKLLIGLGFKLHTYIHTYTLFMLEIYRVAVELMYSRKQAKIK